MGWVVGQKIFETSKKKKKETLHVLNVKGTFEDTKVSRVQLNKKIAGYVRGSRALENLLRKLDLVLRLIGMTK